MSTFPRRIVVVVLLCACVRTSVSSRHLDGQRQVSRLEPRPPRARRFLDRQPEREADDQGGRGGACCRFQPTKRHRVASHYGDMEFGFHARWSDPSRVVASGKRGGNDWASDARCGGQASLGKMPWWVVVAKALSSFDAPCLPPLCTYVVLPAGGASLRTRPSPITANRSKSCARAMCVIPFPTYSATTPDNNQTFIRQHQVSTSPLHRVGIREHGRARTRWWTIHPWLAARLRSACTLAAFGDR